ncbi:aspartate aminotransferase family protein [soil metagenome]
MFDEEKYFMPVYNRLPLEIERGEGSYLYTTDGRKLLDMFGGLAVNVLGYDHKKVNKAVAEQCSKYIHLSNNFYQETQIEFAKLILDMSGFDKLFLCSTGTEGIEGAIKLVRKYFSSQKIKKSGLISFKGGFHGRTYGSLSLTTKEKYRDGFEPFLPDVKHLRFNSTEDLEKNIDETTAAVFLEFIQGEGGVNVASEEFITRIKELKIKYGFLVIADCIQCGAGRTGKFISIQHYKDKDIVDICVCAKGIGAGLPLGAILMKENISEHLHKGEHGTTFGGNPVACAAGIVVLKELKDGLMEKVKEMGSYLMSELEAIKKQTEKIKEIRGIGLMIGIELINSDTQKVSEGLLQNNILVNVTAGNVIRLLPPLIIEKADIDIFIGSFKKILL